MQDKSYVVAIVVVLGICMLGVYVAVSGYFLNTNTSSLVSTTPASQLTSVVVNIPTETLAPITPSLVIPPTGAPVPSPLSALQTITSASASSLPTLPPVLPTIAPKPPSPSSTTASVVSCAGFLYCPKGGPPDDVLGPGGDICPRNYIWGRIVDAAGRGVPNVRIRYRAPTGEVSETSSKNNPDPPGKYDILAPNGTFTVWLVDGTGTVSPQVPVTAQPYSGVGNCPTRVDFVAQR